MRTMCIIPVAAFVLALTLGVAPLAAEDLSNEALLKQLQTIDTRAVEGFALQFEFDSPANVFLPDQGDTTKRGVLTIAGNTAALVYDIVDPPAVSFRPPGTKDYGSVDFDDQGNLIFWRRTHRETLVTPAMNETYDENEMLRIAPNGEILERGTHASNSVYRPDDKQNLGEIERLLWAAGHGYASQLQRIDAQRRDEANQLHVTAYGCYGPKHFGTWELVLDPQRDYLLRSAHFTMDGQRTPTMLVTSTGVKQIGDAVIAAEGTVTFPLSSTRSHVTSVRFGEYQPRPATKLLERLQKGLGPDVSKPNLDVFDYRKDPARPEQLNL